MKKVAIVGYHGDGGLCSDGQGIKTTIITNELIQIYGVDQIKIVNTFNWRKNPLSLILKCLIAMMTCDNIIFLTDENGVKVFPKFFVLLKTLFHRKVHYYVVGGWLTDFVKKNTNIKKYIMKLDAIYVELKSMERDLKEQGFVNINYVNKFRRITPISKESIIKYDKPPYKLCTFSRVFREKGIEESIEAISKINDKYSDVIFDLDIYGKIDENYKKRFNSIMNDQPKYIKYCGVVDFDRSTETLKNYFALLFPTYYKSEGYPNTFVDAFSAGLPVIATDFRYNAEIINSGIDGIIYSLNDQGALENILDTIYHNPDMINDMKIKCISRCMEFRPEKAIEVVVNNLV